jgi:hypothetical protein
VLLAATIVFGCATASTSADANPIHLKRRHTSTRLYGVTSYKTVKRTVTVLKIPNPIKGPDRYETKWKEVSIFVPTSTDAPNLSVFNSSTQNRKFPPTTYRNPPSNHPQLLYHCTTRNQAYSHALPLLPRPGKYYYGDIVGYRYGLTKFFPKRRFLTQKTEEFKYYYD